MKSQDVYINLEARRYHHRHVVDESPLSFHSKLPGFRPTPLRLLSSNVTGIDRLYLKDESERLGLPSFKILGASWGTFRAIVKKYSLSLSADLSTVKDAVQQHDVHLVAATDGNHGRAVARMARLVNAKATIFVPDTVDDYAQEKISGEGAEVLVKADDYDITVRAAYEFSNQASNYLYVQDTSFEGYSKIPTWIVDGYATMLEEVEEQLIAKGIHATHILTPVGVGSLANAVVNHCKSNGRNVTIIAVESEAAGCLQHSLRSGSVLSIRTSKTIMDGLNCGTVSDISWPALRHGVDAAITISDHESHQAIVTLSSMGIKSGPCGAAPFAALSKLMTMPEHRILGIDSSSTIVLLSTEGPRQYVVPA